MKKILFGVVTGIFLGAVAVEVMNRKKPELTREIEKRAKDTVDAFIAVLKEGPEIENHQTKPIGHRQSLI